MVKLTITVDTTDTILNIELPNDFGVADFQSYLESETSIPPSKQKLFYEGKQLQIKDKITLSDLNLEDDSLIALQKIEERAPAPTPTPTSASVSTAMDQQIEYLRQFYISNPNSPIPDPSIREILNDKDKFHYEFKSRFGSQLSALNNSNASALSASQNWTESDEMNPENQARIMEQINRQAIDENMATAYEVSPEAFTTIHMLYINVEVNGVPVKAFVDTGAQTTIISPSLAEKTGLTRLIDKRFVGEARGVGSTKILGKIHSAPLKIGTGFFPCGFTVLNTDVQMLLGLDMLRRFQATIDLKQNKLLIGDVETKFLSENESPKELMSSQQSSTLSQSLGGNIFSPGANFVPSAPQPLQQQQSGSKRTKTNSSGSSSIVAGRPPAVAPANALVVPDPTKVRQLIDLGCDKQTAEQLLLQTKNDVDLAAGMLFG